MRFSGKNYNISYRQFYDGVQLEFVDSCRDLGVIVDVKLRFHEQVLTPRNMSASLTNNLLRCTLNRSPSL